MTSFALADLLAEPFVRELTGDRAVRVSGVASDSRRVRPGDLFAAISGREDGARFVPDAVARGAVAILSDRPLASGLPELIVDHVRARLGPIAHRVYGYPTRAMKTVAVTGTNGKTTVTHLLESVLREAGETPALLGTIVARGPAFQQASELTTPEADVVARFAHEQRAAGATHLVMEASSHALAQDRLRGMDVEVAAFTNLTQDHLDYHGDMHAYGEAKARLFTEFGARNCVLMVDRPFGRALSARASGRVLRASLEHASDAELRVQSHRFTRAGIEARVETPTGELTLHSPLFGTYNLENLLVCVGICVCLGIDAAALIRALRVARGAPGRMERVDTSLDLMVLVDYAHTPDAVERALAAVRPLTSGRVIALAGCGGDRDPQKRAPMGEAALKGADLAVLTSDNPRSEAPDQILLQMEEGARKVAPRLTHLTDADRGYVVIADRAEAIRQAIFAARPGDSVLLLGKGHETYQIVGSERRSFDDRVEARAALAEKEAG